MSENKKPRLCEILGVEAGEKFRVKGYDGYLSLNPDGSFNVLEGSGCGASYCLLRAIENPENIIHRPPLTEPELAICGAAGAKWVTRNSCDHNHRFVNLWITKPVLEYGIYADTDYKEGGLIASFYDYCGLFVQSVKPGDCICVEEAAETGEK